MVTQFDRADITELDAFRRSYSKKTSVKLTVTAIAAKVVASALKVFPQFNCSLDLAKEEVIQKHYIHVGIAVDTGRGLVVPVIKDTDKKSILEIGEDIRDVASRAREGQINVNELQGGTFTITNVGPLGGTALIPTINYPEVAILGMGRVQEKPVVLNGEIVVRHIASTINPPATTPPTMFRIGGQRNWYEMHSLAGTRVWRK